MNTTALALVGLIGWFMALLLLIAGIRTAATLKGKALNSFHPDGTDVSPFSVRVVRAHANCYESFPFIGGLLLLSLATQSANITNPLALTLLAARVCQSVVHMLSTSNLAVAVRFSFFLIQVVISLYWINGFVQKFSV